MAVELFLSPLISLVVNKAADSLIEQFCRMSGMDENRKKLHRHLLGIQEMIADAEERGVHSPLVQEWMKELRAAALKADDVLDEFQYEALRQNAIRQQPCASTKVIEGYFSSESPVSFRYKMSNKLTTLLGKINEIVNEMNKFNFIPRDVVQTIDRETHSFIIESEVIGRGHEKEAIVNTLLDPQRQRDNISVLSIVGMGGLGKTTLVQLIYNDQRVKDHFQLLVWVCVSNDFNVINIIKSVIQVATNGGAISTSNKEVLQRRLHEILDSKRYLLVLDDVWNEEIQKWDDLKILLTSGASSGSVIIVTTRSKEVASIMGTLPGHDLESLNEEESWELFEKRAFGEGGEEHPEEFNEFGKIIVDKCLGLPLALKAIGGLMRSKREIHEWRDIAENITWEGEGSANGILPVLKLSYDHLPSYIKQCFAFCAIFPQDHEIERETLIQLWMANDFIPTGRPIDLEEKGRVIFNELYLRSFLQEIREKKTEYGSIITCKMHDLMHDLATQIAGKRCSSGLKLDNPEIDKKEIEHLSISGSTSPGISSVLEKFPVIRTYLLRDYQEPENQYILMKLSSLRALWFKPNFLPPKELRYMKHIRYLDLSFGEFDILPETISTLYNLQTLKLSGSKIHELPKDMRNMNNLRHLFLDGCDNLKRMPIDLGQLKDLRTLTKHIASSGIGRTISELENLNLWGHLSLSGLETVTDRDAKAANLASKINLYSLELKWEATDNEGTTKNNQAVLDALTPHNELKYLNISGYSGTDFSKWMMESLIIRNLKRLRLMRCFKCAALPPVWQLPLLEDLYLAHMESVTYIVGMRAEESESLIIFPNLKVLEVVSLPNLESWHEKDSELVRFPKLNHLVISECPKLKIVLAHAPLLNGLKVKNFGEIKLHQISNLPVLSVLRITALTSPTEPDVFKPPKTLVEMEIDGFENVSPLEEEDNQSSQAASLANLTITKSNCFFSYGSTKLALGFWKYFAALKYLSIEKCNAIVFWSQEEFGGLNCLKKLNIVDCKSFTGSSQTLRGEDFLPHLEELRFENCPELMDVSGCFKSLKELRLYYCPKLSQQGLALTNFTELKTLKLRDCTNLRALPDGMEHLTSLEWIEIWSCPGMESFPEGLQQRLSALQTLWIKYCPALERHCRHEGDYWHLVSTIPNRGFPTERESFLRRLLPRCGRYPPFASQAAN